MKEHGQQGLTLIELLVAASIAGIVLPVVAAGIFQITRGTVNVNRDQVIQQAFENASSWLTRDLSLAQTTDVVDEDPAVNSIRVDWVDETGWAVEGSESYYAIYSLSGTVLQRNYNGVTNNVARNVESISFSRSGDLITVSITCTFEGETESLVYFINPRPDEALTTQ